MQECDANECSVGCNEDLPNNESGRGCQIPEICDNAQLNAEVVQDRQSLMVGLMVGLNYRRIAVHVCNHQMWWCGFTIAASQPQFVLLDCDDVDTD